MEDTSVKTEKTEKKQKKDNKKKFDIRKVFSNLKMEFEKIIWPTRDDLFKMTAAVLTSSVVLGIVIAVIDMLVKFGLGLIIA